MNEQPLSNQTGIMHTFVKCATPECKNGVRWSTGDYCPACQQKRLANQSPLPPRLTT